jgi:predicted PurR-regulated permease PerM
MDEDGGIPGAAARAAREGDTALAPRVDPALLTAPDAAAAPPPVADHLVDVPAPTGNRAVGTTVLTVLAVLFSLYVARGFLIPIVFALLLNFLFSPVIRRLARVRIKPPVGAGLVVLLLVGGIGVGVYQLAGPAQRWAASAPQSFSKAQRKLRAIILPVQQVSRNVEQAANAVGGPVAEKKPEVVVQAGPSLSSRLFGTTQRIAAGLVEIFILLYFLLAGGDLFLQKLIKVLPHFGDKLKAVEIARATEATVSAYLSTTLLLNIGEGIVVALALWLLGMPNVVLWGVMVAALEFVPYLGAATATVVLGVAGLSQFDQLGHALMIPGAYLLINLVQSNLLTPMMLGHRLTLNPVAIFVGLAFFFWIWGVPGAFLAVPILATMKILCDNIESLAALGEFLGQRDEDERRATARVP